MRSIKHAETIVRHINESHANIKFKGLTDLIKESVVFYNIEGKGGYTHFAAVVEFTRKDLPSQYFIIEATTKQELAGTKLSYMQLHPTLEYKSKFGVLGSTNNQFFSWNKTGEWSNFKNIQLVEPNVFDPEPLKYQLMLEKPLIGAITHQILTSRYVIKIDHTKPVNKYEIGLKKDSLLNLDTNFENYEPTDSNYDKARLNYYINSFIQDQNYTNLTENLYYPGNEGDWVDLMNRITDDENFDINPNLKVHKQFFDTKFI